MLQFELFIVTLKFYLYIIYIKNCLKMFGLQIQNINNRKHTVTTLNVLNESHIFKIII